MAKLMVPGTTVGLLSQTDKLHHASWGTRALVTCPWKKFGMSEAGNQAICGVSAEETSCYATRGRSVIASVKRAYNARADWTLAALRDPEIGEQWVSTMIEGVLQSTAKGRKVFRWFDAGDVISPAHAYMIADVVHHTPEVQHWLPTRSWQGVIREWEEFGSPPVGTVAWDEYMAADLRWSDAFSWLCAYDNIAVRPSALYVNEPFDPRHLEVLLALGFSGPGEVTTEGNYTCPASDQDGRCDGSGVPNPSEGVGTDCTACYVKDSSVRRYKTHAASFITVEGLVGAHGKRYPQEVR